MYLDRNTEEYTSSLEKILIQIGKNNIVNYSKDNDVYWILSKTI